MAVVINGTTGITNDGGYTGDGIVFADTTPANTLVTTTGGNVGIGTISPATKLDVNGDLTLRNGAGVTIGKIWNDSGLFSFQGSTNVNGIKIEAQGAQYIASYTNGSERARIDSSGNLLVGRNTAYSDGSMGTPLIQAGGINGARSGAGFIQNSTAATGAIGFANPNGFCGSISTSGTSTSYGTSSDYRLKENIEPMVGALSVVQALNPVTYNWKFDGSGGQGFIAHELQAVVPDCVTGEKDAVDAEGKPVYQGIDTSFLVATLTAAIQEQQAQIVSLQDTVTSQAEALASLTTRLAALEAK